MWTPHCGVLPVTELLPSHTVDSSNESHRTNKTAGFLHNPSAACAPQSARVLIYRCKNSLDHPDTGRVIGGHDVQVKIFVEFFPVVETADKVGWSFVNRQIKFELIKIPNRAIRNPALLLSLPLRLSSVPSSFLKFTSKLLLCGPSLATAEKGSKPFRDASK